jgi:hypothetical protein
MRRRGPVCPQCHVGCLRSKLVARGI